MIKASKTIVAVCAVFFCAATASSLNAAVDLPWSTTYNCPEWNQTQGGLSCNGLQKALDGTCQGQGEQITQSANYPGGGGGKGQRHWQGDGTNSNSGGTLLNFNSPQKELWIRWYMRYEKGFKWSSLSYDKWLYINTGAQGKDCIPEFYGSNGISVGAQGTPNPHQVFANKGWQAIYGSQSDGSWFCVEIHIKMDTNGSNGIGRLWLNGELIASNTAVNWSGGNSTARQGWTRFLIGSNQKSPSNGRPMYVDFDDFYVTNTRPSNRDAHGNYFIGPIGSGSNPPTEPQQPPTEPQQPPAEPQNPPATSAVILSETWEQNNENNWKFDYAAGDTRIETSPVYAGNYAIKMRSSNPGNYVHFFGDHPLLSRPGQMVTNVTVEEYYYPSEGFRWPSTAMKLWIMNCFESWNAGYNRAEGQTKPNTWAPYYMAVGVDSSGRPFAELTRADGLGGTGDIWHAYSQNVGSPVALVPGKWNKIKFRLKLNDLGKSNGVFQLWINDNLKCDYSSMNFRGAYSRLGWNHVMMSMHGVPSHPQNQWISRDNIRILSGEGRVSAISPPSGIQVRLY